MMQMKLRWIAFLFFTLVIVGVHAQQRHSDGLDDVLQYVPYASVLTLKACGVESRDEWPQLLVATAGSWVVSAGVAYTLKHSIHEWRPDNSDNRSFPSGHTTFAFAGATVLHKEFGHLSPWISVAGYGVATLTAVDRVCRDRHHWYDACAGAAIGFLSTELTYYVTDRLFPKRNATLALTTNSIGLHLTW
jgi:membrane-associated phospholipid phosphatase